MEAVTQRQIRWHSGRCLDGGRWRCEDAWGDELQSHWDVVEAVAALILAGESINNEVVQRLLDDRGSRA